MNNIKLIGIGATLLGAIATLIGNWADEKKMEQTVDEKVNEALAKREVES